ncbi:RNA polymerase-associated protein RapA [Frondihabitans sp. 762G35]|uniref:DEAD/DEAH box helicase n=1 Tax=Frondihabitans sp. 762G35 TaxID=1446794 RepID=UPI000D22AF53|nr:DEAD/DEAH box helicase [Frondihabitans sp. 762G35]ARC56971.1 RNA polymerase-associated protein RapA [Frondihabitans sp. 762G35]
MTDPARRDDAVGWKERLTGLSDSPAATPSRATRLGLQFELRERLRASRGRWDPPSSRTAAPGRPSAEGFWLGVRPVMLSDTGNWIRGVLTWSTLPFQQNRLRIDPEQHRWFGQFAAVHRSLREGTAPGETGWIALDDFASPLLWPLLRDAERLGIAFSTGKKETDVVLGERASVGIDVTRSAAGDLLLAPVSTIDGAAQEPGAVGSLADHGLYAWSLDPRPSFLLAPTGEPLAADQRRLVTRGSAILVPAAEEPEFLRDFYPGLRRAVEVGSSDGSVEFPALRPPELVATLTFARGDRLDVAWAWENLGRREPLAAHDLPDGIDEVLGGPPRDRTLRGIAAAEFSAEVVPRLQRIAGVRVEIVGTRPAYRELTDPPELVVTVVETDKRDWFDLGVLVTVQGTTVPFAKLFTALSKRQAKLLLVDKTYLSLKHPAFDELRRLIEEAEALDEWETGLRINRHQIDLWSDLEELADQTVQAESWQRTVGGLRALLRELESDTQPGEQAPLPAGVAASLRPYQVDGFRWLAFLHDHSLGGILADDMGLGKTLQTLALVAHAREREPGAAPFLVVAPTSVVSTWASEAARFTPGLVVRGVTATEAKRQEPLADLARGADVIVTSYALFRLDFGDYGAFPWSGLVLDEAQFVKNRSSKAHQCAVDLDAPFKLAITGTPLENGLSDIWSLFRIVAPGLLPSQLRFQEEYVKPVSLGDRPDLIETLRRRIRPLMLRRTKERVASELPAKQEQVLRIDLTPDHRELYDAFLQRERQKLLGLTDLDRQKFIVFRSLTLLRLLALDASLVDQEFEGVASAKIDALLDELDAVVAGGHRALVFSQFTSFLARVSARLDERSIGHLSLDGSTTKRDEVIGAFRRGDVPVFLISLKAGGFGLTLTEADYVFLLDPWWNPAAETQAIDRTHRLGQTKNVVVYRMIANDTVEEKVMALQQSKAKLADSLLDDDEAAFGSLLSADDLRGLFEG